MMLSGFRSPLPVVAISWGAWFVQVAVVSTGLAVKNRTGISRFGGMRTIRCATAKHNKYFTGGVFMPIFGRLSANAAS